MNFRGILAAIALIAASVSLACAQGSNRITMPAWPKDFKLLPGQKVEFGIPINAAGQIVVSARWQGTPLTVSLKDPSGQPVAAIGAGAAFNPPSASLTFAVTAADLSKGSVWQVSVTAPGKFNPASQSPAATGQVTVQSPPISENQMRAMVDKLRPAITAQLATLQAKRTARPAVTPASLLARSQASALAASAAELRKQEAALRGKMGTNLSAFSTRMLKSSARPTKPFALNQPKAVVTNAKPPVTPSAAVANQPTLTLITPNQAMPGDQVVLSGKHLPLDKAQSEARFVIGSGIDLPATILSVSQAGEIVNYQVQVPADPTAAAAFNGQVYMNIKTSGVTTNSLDFGYTPAPLATIASTAPVTCGPGEMLLLNGSNFSASDSVFFLWGTGDPVKAAEKQYFSPQQMRVKVPDYSSKLPLNMLVYVVNKGLAQGPLYSIAMQPTTPEIESLTNAAGRPGEPVLISGMGFRAPLEVHFVDQSGKDRTSSIKSSDACSILTNVPDVSGVAADSPWKVYVKSAGVASAVKDFTFKPAMETKLLDVKAAGIKTDSAVDGIWGENLSLDQMMDWFNAHWDFWEYGRGSDNAVVASHRGGQFWGRSGIDTYFKTFTLKNGWLVQSVNLDAQFQPGEASASLIFSLPNTPRPMAQVLWWDTTSRDLVNYSLTFTIIGPKGLPYM